MDYEKGDDKGKEGHRVIHLKGKTGPGGGIRRTSASTIIDNH